MGHLDEMARRPIVRRALVMAAVALGRISTFSGLKVQEDSSGSPEQERVTNMGAVSAEEFSGVMEVVMVPDAPRPSDSVAGAMEIWKSGTAPA